MSNNNKLLGLQKDLLSGDKDRIVKAIQQVAHDGSPAVIHHLLLATFKSGFPEALEEGKKFFLISKIQMLLESY